jgi:hypothetical protein
MIRIPPPWVIDEMDRLRREDTDRDRPRPEVRPTPRLPRSVEQTPGPIVIDAWSRDGRDEGGGCVALTAFVAFGATEC